MCVACRVTNTSLLLLVKIFSVLFVFSWHGAMCCFLLPFLKHFAAHDLPLHPTRYAFVEACGGVAEICLAEGGETRVVLSHVYRRLAGPPQALNICSTLAKLYTDAAKCKEPPGCAQSTPFPKGPNPKRPFEKHRMFSDMFSMCWQVVFSFSSSRGDVLGAHRTALLLPTALDRALVEHCSYRHLRFRKKFF